MRAKAAPGLIPESHNYPGFQDINGKTQFTRLREQTERYSADPRSGGVTKLLCENFLTSRDTPAAN